MSKESEAKYEPTHYPDEWKLREILSGGERMVIPVHNLFGRQKKDEYSNDKRKSARAEIKRDPNYLLRTPIYVCAILSNTATQLVIIDGHHRARYAPLEGVREIPSLVFLPGQLIDPEAPVFPERSVPDLVARFERETAEAQATLRIPDAKRPIMLPPVTSLRQLPFKRF